MCIDEGVLMKVWFLKLWEHFFACKRYCKQMQKKQSFEKKMSEIISIISINFCTSPFQPPQNGGPGAFFNRANRGSPKNPSISTQPPKVQKGGVARVEQWTFGHDGHHWTHCSGCPVGRSSLGWTSRWTLRNTQNTQKPFK